MQSLRLLALEPLERLQPDLKMLADALPIEIVSHAGELYFTMKWFIRNAEQGAVWDTETEAVSGDSCRLHVEGDGA